MKFFVTLLLITLSKLAISQSKDFIIKTKNLLISQKKIDVFINPEDIGFRKDNDLISSIFLGRIKLSYFSEDSICFKIKRYVPIQIKGLNQILNERVIIKKISLTRYNPIDSIYTYSVKYFDKDSLDLTSEKVTSSTPNNSYKFDNSSITEIEINNKSYESKTLSIPYEGEGWYCNPGKHSYNQYIKKIDKFYLFEIKN